MSVVHHLVAYGLRQVIGESAEHVIETVQRRFSDHSRALPKALARANDRAWQALAVALAGDGWLDSLHVFFASGEAKGFREQVRSFLEGKPLPFETTPAAYRKACLGELKQARKSNLLSADADSASVVEQAASLRRYSTPYELIEGAAAAVGRVADDLATHCPNLATLLRERPDDGPPLLAAAFAYFFRREVETHAELARGLLFDGLRQLSARQEAGLAAVAHSLEALGERFDEMFERVLVQLDRIEGVAAATHGAVLDLQSEMQRLGGLHLKDAEEIRRLLVEVQERLSRIGMQRGEVRPEHSLSIRSEDERRAVKALLGRFRELPAFEQRQVPALLNGLGKLQLGAGDFAAAEETFQEVASGVDDALARAEACHNAYRAALENGKWELALDAIEQAARLAPERFTPFPLHRYQARRILGAGGFGTAFLCQDRYLRADVVVKALHVEDLDRGLEDVFAEAQTLRLLRHPAIIDVLDCSYADPDGPARPYIVMDYFPGTSLETHIARQGTLPLPDLLSVAGQIAEAMQAAHDRGILHRDLKPDNVLVRHEGGRWEVKVIDFGLALRRQATETTPVRSQAPTLRGDSVAGTIRYAPPEQMGQLLDARGKRVPVGPYSDVYSFGKLCCQALFRTTEPRSRHLQTIPPPLRDLLERCIEEDLAHRHTSFTPVLAALRALRGVEVDRRQRQDAEENRSRLQQEGEVLLVRRYREILDRTQGNPTGQDRSAIIELCRAHVIPQERAKAILRTALEEWKGASKAKKGLQPGKVIANSIGMKFAWCPPGSFLMGSPLDEEGRSGEETQHQVVLTQGFWMGVTPVTQAQWRAVMENNPSHFPGEDAPVETVSWEECQEFCRKLSRKNGEHYRLPTEAEWEYACRAGTTFPFSFGKVISTEVVNFDPCRPTQGRQGLPRRRTAPVGSFPANAWGLFDMHGNVFEWCQDWYLTGYYTRSEAKDPRGPSNGVAHVLRGGCWDSLTRCCRAAYRHGLAPSYRGEDVGFRVILWC
jgi:formylglycine-generating enzyme required for sulfatase activity/tetratricopeptide (TPR) repeat protein